MDCGATLSVPVSEVKTGALKNCPSCNARWTDRPGLNFADLILNFTGTLTRLQEATKPENMKGLPFILMLEVKPEAAPRTLYKTA
jgi:hypothetical protein